MNSSPTTLSKSANLATFAFWRLMTEIMIEILIKSVFKRLRVTQTWYIKGYLYKNTAIKLENSLC